MRLPDAARLLSEAARSLSRWEDARRTRAALGRLSRHELWDIGLDHGDLEMDALTGRR